VQLDLSIIRVLRTLVEKEGDLRGKAIFALGYWAGCRVSDVAHLLMEHTHISPKVGWLRGGPKGEKFPGHRSKKSYDSCLLGSVIIIEERELVEAIPVVYFHKKKTKDR
jgi:hypothetical protein